jgi:hypothetical protein
VQTKLRDNSTAQFWTGLFNRDDVKGLTQLRIFWSWSTGAKWEAPDSPRIAFGRSRALYKMYVIHNVTGLLNPTDDPSAKLLGELLPILEAALEPS